MWYGAARPCRWPDITTKPELGVSIYRMPAAGDILRARAPTAVLVACCFWPFLHVAEHNKNQLDLESFFALLAAAALLSALAWVIAKMARRLWPNSGAAPPLALAMAVVLFFNYQAFFETLSGLGITRINYIYLALAILLPTWVWRLARRPEFVRAVVVFSSAVIAIPAASLTWYAVQSAQWHNDQAQPPIRTNGSALERRNVYHVIIDGYGRHDQLRQVLGFDNRPALDFLRSHGFFVAEEAYANYPLSFLSISSSFSGQYPVSDGDTFFDRTRFHDLISGHNQTVSRFKAAGYAYVHAASSVWSHSDCGGREDYCIQTQHQLFGSVELVNLVTELTPAIYLRTRFGLTAAQPMNFSYLRQELEAILKRETRPLFVFAHTFPPHPPWIYERDCRLRNRGSSSNIRDDWTEDAKGMYLDNLECVNRQMAGFVRFVVERDPEAIVVIQSDHGPAFTVDWNKALEEWSKKEFEERFAILLAVRAPEGCASGLRADMTPVNVYSFVFGCLQGTTPIYRENTFLLVTEGQVDSKPRRVLRYKSR